MKDNKIAITKMRLDKANQEKELDMEQLQQEILDETFFLRHLQSS